MSGPTLTQAFLTTVDRRADQVALRWKDPDGQWAQWTFADYADVVARAVAGFRGLGVQAGDRVVLMLHNTPEFHVVDLALKFCGAIPVSIYNSSAPDQIAHLAMHCDAVLAVVSDADLQRRFAAVIDKLPSVKGIVVVSAEGIADPAVIPWAHVVEAVAVDLGAYALLATPETTATIIYTSGTTGPPKGVVITHANVMDELAGLATKYGEDVAGKRMVSYLPMAHIAERMISHYSCAALGVEVSCCPDPGELPTYLVEVRPQILFGVPRIWEKIRAKISAAIGANPEQGELVGRAIAEALPIALRRNHGTSSLEDDERWEALQQAGLRAITTMVGLDAVEYGLSGAAPIPVEVIEWYLGLGVPLSEVYGLSETTGAITWSPTRIRPGTVGTVMPGSELRLAEDGEVLCRGPLVFGGYYDDPDRTGEVLDEDGWFHTGDIGRLDASGYLKVIDRKKELIITSGGKNISPANLEAALKSHPLVGQVCVVGDGRPYTAALVVLDPDVAPGWADQHAIAASSLAALAQRVEIVDEIARWVEDAMSAFNGAERVKRFVVLGDEWLPDSEELTPTMKLKRRGIYAKYAGAIESLYEPEVVRGDIGR